MFGLRVVQDDGAPVGWTQSALRNLMRPADMLPFGYAFGLVSCVLSEDFKRLGDRVAGTIVVHTERSLKLGRLGEGEPFPLPVNLSLEEQATLLEFASRAPAWTLARQAEVADHASELTSCSGREGVQRLYGMARWIRGET